MSMKSLLGRMCRENKWKLAALALLVAGSAAASLVPPQLLRVIIDRCLSEDGMRGLPALAAAYLAALVLIGLADFLMGAELTRLGQRVIHGVRGAMMEKASRISMRFFTSEPAGAVVSRFTTDVESINTLFADGIVSLAADSLKIVGIIISMALFSGGLAITAAALIPILYFITRLFQKGMLKAQTANLAELGAVSSHVSESVTNASVIKLMGREKYMEDMFCRRLLRNYRTKQTVNAYDSCYSPVIQLVRAAAISIIVVLCAGRGDSLGISAGTLAASIELLSNLLAPVESLGMELQSIQQGISGIRRVDGFLRLAEEEKDGTITAARVAGPERRVRVALENVSFSYDGENKVLNGVSAAAEPCGSVTIAGRTGVGKTTLMNLILGFLKPDEGSVTVNGFPAHLIPDGEKRRIFGYVEQRFQFVPGSVERQITLGDESVTREEVESACRFVGLSECIEALPNGYDTVLRDGSEFSFGQRQLLSIARAIAADPPVLLLDEITANLDSATEERVVGVLNRACRDRTIIAISHRSTSIVNCDKLVYIENGRVAAEGTPADVLARIGRAAAEAE